MKDQKQVQEFIDPVTAGSIALTVLVPLAIQLASMFTMLTVMIKRTKEDVKLSKKLNAILKDGKQWRVMIFPDKSPNAFAMIKPYVFLTSGLLKMMNEDEIMAVMLHEAGHINNYDVWRDIIAESTFQAIIFTAVAALAGPIALWALIFFWMMGADQIFLIVMKRTMGRAAENRADNFAVKYGYGDHLVSALNKIEALINKNRAKYECGIMCKLSEKISEALDEHPPLKERVGNIMKAKETWEKAKNASFVAMRDFFRKAFNLG